MSYYFTLAREKWGLRTRMEPKTIAIQLLLKKIGLCVGSQTLTASWRKSKQHFCATVLGKHTYTYETCLNAKLNRQR